MENELKKTTVYVPASYSPRKSEPVLASGTSYITGENLDAKEGYFLTEQQLLDFAKKVAGEAWDAGAWNEQDGQNAIHGSKPKTDYINNLNIEP